MQPEDPLSPSLYRRLHAGFTLVSIAVALMFIGKELLGLALFSSMTQVSVLSVVPAGLQIIYAISGYFALERRSPRRAAILSLVLSALAVAIGIVAAGTLKSPLYLLWLMLIGVGGALGGTSLIALTFGTTLYFAILNSSLTPSYNAEPLDLLLLFSSYLVALVSFFPWRNYYGRQLGGNGDGKLQSLQTNLDLEQLKGDILFRSIGDGVIIVDTDGKIELINHNAEVLTNWREDEARGLRYDTVMPLSDNEGKDLLNTNDDPFMQAFSKSSSIVRDDIVLRTRAQNTINLALTVSPILIDNKELKGAIAIFRDVSEEKRANRQRDEFISTASHEMRTPVAAIEGYLALAMNEKVSKIDDKARTYLNKAHEEVEHLGQLFRDLLSITKLEEGKLPDHPKPTEINDIVLKVIDEARFVAEKKGLELNFKNGTEIITEQSVKPLFYAMVDPERLREAIVNLIDNAIKYTKRGEVFVSAQADTQVVTIGVHDTGVGISPEDQRHLFEKFYRIDNTKTREVGGTGLGLYIVRTLIENYGGRIWVESEPDKGSVFYFSLPRLNSQKAEEMIRKGTATAGAGVGTTEPIKQTDIQKEQQQPTSGAVTPIQPKTTPSGEPERPNTPTTPPDNAESAKTTQAQPQAPQQPTTGSLIHPTSTTGVPRAVSAQNANSPQSPVAPEPNSGVNLHQNG